VRILVLNWRDLAHPSAGGAEVYTSQVTRAWAQAGHQVTWFSAAVAGSPGDEVLDGVRHVRRGSRLSVYAEARRFVEGVGSREFDLVIDEVNTRPFLTPRWLRDVPSVALIHQLCREIWWHEAPLPVALAGRLLLERRWLASYAETPTFTISRSSKTSLESYGLRNVSIVPVGCETTARPDVERESSPTVLFVGRLASNKRPGDALRAFEHARVDIPGLKLWVVGSGPEQSRLSRRAPEGVTFFGQVDAATKRELMARAHVLVVTSVREGWGLVVDEAAAMGTPAIGYAVPGLIDSIPAAGGRLVAPRPEALADALRAGMPELVAHPVDSGWTSGARPWDEVAQTFLDMCVQHAAIAR